MLFEKKRKAFLSFKANTVSKLIIWSLNPIFKVCYKCTLNFFDIFTLDPSQQVAMMYAKFNKNLDKNFKK